MPVPAIGDKYISSATANGWIINYIYEWNGTTWIGTAPVEGMVIYIKCKDAIYKYTGTEWEPDVRCQSATPGTQQVGNINISGRIINTSEQTTLIVPNADGVAGLIVKNAAGTSPILQIDTTTKNVIISRTQMAASLEYVNLLAVNHDENTNLRGIADLSAVESDFGARLNLMKSRGNPNAPTIVQVGDVIGRVIWKAYDGANWLDEACIRLEVPAGSTVALTRIASDMVFYTSSDTLPSLYREVFRLTANGDALMLQDKFLQLENIRAIRSQDDAIDFEDKNGLTIVHYDFNPTGGYWNVRFAPDNGNNILFTVKGSQYISGAASLTFVSDAGGAIGSRIANLSQATFTNYVSTAHYFQVATGVSTEANSYMMQVMGTGVQFGNGFSPTALIHPIAGTATAGTAPLKFTTGTLLTVPEAGAVEFAADLFYTTCTTSTRRKIIAQSNAVEDTAAGPITLDKSYETVVKNQAAANTINLPAATGSGKTYTIKNIGAGAVTVDGNAAETIDGAATVILAQWDSITVQDYASGLWVII